MDLQSTYNKIAEDWFRDHHDDTWWIEGMDRFIALFDRGNTIMDVGCGPGGKTKYLIGKGLRVVGIDFSEKMVEIARREVHGGEFHVMDMKNIARLKGCFDGIFVQAALLHIPKREIGETLKNFRGKLKTGGYLYIAVKEIKQEGVEEEVKVEDDYGYPYERFFSYFTPDELRKYLHALNMGVVYEKISPVGNARWIEIIGRK